MSRIAHYNTHMYMYVHVYTYMYNVHAHPTIPCHVFIHTPCTCTVYGCVCTHTHPYTCSRQGGSAPTQPVFLADWLVCLAPDTTALLPAIRMLLRALPNLEASLRPQNQHVYTCTWRATVDLRRQNHTYNINEQGVGVHVRCVQVS